MAVTAAEVTSVQDDAAFFSYVLNAQKHYSNTAQQWTAYKTQARNGDGGSLGTVPVAPTLGTPPTAVAPGIFRRIGNLIARVKKHPGYTEAIGQDLDIIGAEQAVDLNTTAHPQSRTQAGHPNILEEAKMGGLKLMDRGTGGFVFLALDTIPDYLDTAQLPAPGTSAVWKYKAIYRLNDDRWAME